MRKPSVWDDVSGQTSEEALMIVFIDMDGVIVDFVGGLEEWYNIDLSHHDQFNFDYEKIGMTADEFWGGLTDKFWVDLPFTPWAYELLQYLKQYKPILLSSPARYNAGGKQKWIARNLPEYFHSHRYILGHRKWAAAGPGKILIDDHDKNCLEWAEHGGWPVLFPRRWNSGRSFCPDNRLHWVRLMLEALIG